MVLKKEENMFEILKENQYSEYEDFALRHPNGTFMQSIHWAEVKRNWGSAVLVSRGEDGRIRGGMAILTQELEGYGKNFLYVPRGPVMDYHDEETFADLTAGVRELARQKNAFQFKMDPMVLSTDQEFIEMARRYGYLHTPDLAEYDTIQRRCNYMIDLTKFHGDTEALMQSFHQKWRYNIRLASRRGVECRVVGKEMLPEFERLYEETGLRDNYLVRPEIYFHYFLDAFGDQVRLYMCFYEDKPISAAIATNYAGKTCYVYGASSNEERNRMPNHLMQWNMMMWAMETGCSIYDFQAIPIGLDKAETMSGVYHFKQGFNGDVKLFAGEFDIIFDEEVKKASDAVQKDLAEKKRRMKEEAQKKAEKL